MQIMCAFQGTVRAACGCATLWWGQLKKGRQHLRPLEKAGTGSLGHEVDQQRQHRSRPDRGEKGCLPLPHPAWGKDESRRAKRGAKTSSRLTSTPNTMYVRGAVRRNETRASWRDVTTFLCPCSMRDFGYGVACNAALGLFV